MSESIIGVAIQHGKLTLSMPAPARHGDLIRDIYEYGLKDACHGEQGFVTGKGKFVTRADAKHIASKAGQIIRDTSGGSDDLYSEDVW